MASKVKKYNHYIVLRRGKTKELGCTTLGRFIVAAKNEKEAEQFVKDKIGKHINVKVYYKVREDDTEYIKKRHGVNRLNYGDVRRD